MKTKEIKETISSQLKKSSTVTDFASKKTGNYSKPPKIDEDDDSSIVLISAPFSSEEKERTIFILQIVAAGFLFASIMNIFNYISLVIYVIIGAALAGYIIYTLLKKVKLMYGPDFPAYRDFFLMYLVVGVILVVVGNNPNVVMAFSFQFFPSLSILVFAMVAVVAVFLIFRIRYSRDFTFGKVIEGGENTAYVKVDYDIRSNVKPDLYIVDNHYGAATGDDVKLKVEQKILSSGGNKPVSIIETIEKI
ncbi:MAG TPA: DUF2101 family protein [Methanobacteriaceae archaeon]|nr:DUF2101 family protein [Methanobacteriaceae archaeon]